MTGPEHYREAEQLLAACGFDSAINADYADQMSAPTWLAAAQAHATLALAAATALGTSDDMWPADGRQWEAAASAHTPGQRDGGERK